MVLEGPPPRSQQPAICSHPKPGQSVRAVTTDLIPTSISKMHSNTTFNIYIANRCFYIACLNNYMLRPLHRPSSGCTLSYYKTNYTIYNVFVFVDEISFTSIKFAFKIISSSILYSLLYNKKVYNLMMADIEVKTCSC